MALNTNQLYSESTRAGLPAIQPQEGPGAVVARTFSDATSSETLPVGTPVYAVLATGELSKCVPTATSGAELDVIGFVYPTPVTLVSGSQVVGTVMMRGSIPLDVVEAMNTVDGGSGVLAGTKEEIQDMLRKPGLHDRGLHIDGLTRIGATTDALGNDNPA